MKVSKLLVLILVIAGLQACAGPGKPGEAPLTQPSSTPSNDYMYRSPPSEVAGALR